jgi:hypothetical protein
MQKPFAQDIAFYYFAYKHNWVFSYLPIKLGLDEMRNSHFKAL